LICEFNFYDYSNNSTGVNY